jgi:phosphoglucosamine mutase
LGFAAASVLGGEKTHPKILIGRDTRASGPALEAALAAGVIAAGGVPVSLGVLPTAGIAHEVHTSGAAAGAVISASHNPAADNGIKFFGPDGMKLADEIEDRIEAAMRDDLTGATEPTFDEGALERYITFLCEGAVDLHGLHVVVDCAHGAASAVAPEVYRRCGARVDVINAEPDGANINDGCGSTHPEALQREVVARKADLGIAHDGDADRMLAVDASGNLVDGDQIIGICAIDAHALGELKGDAVVATVMSNLGFRRAMQDAGIDVVETAVGDRYVLAAMLERGLHLGGEQSGHIIFLDRHTTGDGILAGLRLMAAMIDSGEALATLAARIPRFPQVLQNVPVRDRTLLEGATAVWDEVAAVEAEMRGDGRVLVRASGTEQLVRVMAEAPDQAIAEAAVERVAAVVRAHLG